MKGSGSAESIRHLRNPFGAIPIHRISHIEKALWEVLLRDLSIVGEAEPCAAGDAMKQRAPERER
jgi:hypothetical protein